MGKTAILYRRIVAVEVPEVSRLRSNIFLLLFVILPAQQARSLDCSLGYHGGFWHVLLVGGKVQGPNSRYRG
jgi:hypothetical protein